MGWWMMIHEDAVDQVNLAQLNKVIAICKNKNKGMVELFLDQQDRIKELEQELTAKGIKIPQTPEQFKRIGDLYEQTLLNQTKEIGQWKHTSNILRQKRDKSWT